MNNPWKYVLVDPEAARTNPYLNPRTSPAPEPEPEPEPEPTATSLKSGKYTEMPRADTYALGVQALHQACVVENNRKHPTFVKPDGNITYRPLTFKETIE